MVRSLTSDPDSWINLSINQRNPNPGRTDPGHGVFVHYLALTFSTLLSSQASGAHRAETKPGLGQLDLLYEVHRPASNRQCPSPPVTKEPGLRAAHTERVTYRLFSWASGFLPGRPPSVDSVPHPVKALTTLQLRAAPVNPQLAAQRRATVTAPMVFLPRRTMT